MRLLTTLFISLFVVHSFLFAESEKENYYFHQISLAEGLSQPTIKTICRDHIGLLWIGTREGLNRYDGTTIQQYFFNTNDSSSIPDNNILHIIEDYNKDLWILTENGMCRYNRRRDSFERVKVNGKNILFRKARSYKNKLYFPAANGVFIYDCSDKSWKESYFSDPKINLTMECKLEVLDDDHLLIGSRWKGLYEYNLKTRELKKSGWYDNRMILDLYKDKNNHLWVSEYEGGIYCFDRQGNLLTDISKLTDAGNINMTMNIMEYKDEMWFATDGKGLFSYSNKTNRVLPVKYYQNMPFAPLVKSFLTLYVDEYSNLWAGSIRSGIFEVKRTGIIPFSSAPLNSEKGLSDMSVLCFYEDAQGKIWIGTDGGGVNLFYPETHTFKHFPATFGKKVVSITGFSPNELLISLYNEGLMLFDKNSGVLKPFYLIRNNNSLSWEHWIGANVFSTDNDNIYIATGKVYAYSKSKKTFREISGQTDGVARFYKQQANSDILLLFDNSNIFRLNTKTDVITPLFNITPEMGVLNTVLLSHQGMYWIGTSNGLYTRSANRFYKSKSKRFKVVSSIVADKSGSLWIGSGINLYQYFADDKDIVPYGKSDGLPPNEYLPYSLLSAKTGEIYLGGANGFIKISDNISKSKKNKPEFLMLNVSLDGAAIPENNFIQTKKETIIKAPWNFTSLQMQVFINTPELGFRKPCRYSIDGGKSYKDIENQYITLERLSAGNYKLQIQYELQNEKWSEPVNLVKIKVYPPWWRTWWFTLLIVGLVLLSLYYLKRKSQEKAQLKRKEERQQLEHELSEEKIRFMINISHELRTPLTLIYSPLRRLLQADRLSDSQRTQFSVMYKHAENMKTMIDMVLDVRKMEKLKEGLRAASYDFNQWITGIVNGFQLEFESKNIRLQTQLDENVEKVDFEKERMNKVLSNLLMNAIKFSENNSWIIVRSELKNERVRVSVLDEGQGILPEDAGRLFTRFYQGKHEKGGTGIGLSYSKIQVELHHGSIGHTPNTPKGAVFWFEIPLHQTEKITDAEQIISTSEQHSVVQPDISQISNTERLSELSLLIVEDEVDLLNYMKDSLKDIFKEIHIASDGKSALQIIERQKPGIIISDVMMPEMNGFELCKAVKTNLEISHIPVILLTAFSDDDNKLLGYKMGADYYIAKPFAMDVLINLTANLIHSRDMLKQNYADNAYQRIEPQNLTFSNSDEKFMKKFVDLIQRNIDNSELEIDQLASDMAMSRSSFYTKVKAITGLTANNFIIDYKMKLASSYLTQSDEPIQEIAIRLGFDNQRYFSTVFKQYFKHTPTEFRKSRM